MSRRIVGWDEQDAFTGWRRVVHWRPGVRHAVKLRARRRERRAGKEAIRKDEW